jgi:non-canonical (house-cleaning) NTP pyrophosphatase
MEANEHVWFDIGVVALYNCITHTTHYATSQGLPFPATVCKLVQPHFQQETVGSRMGKQFILDIKKGAMYNSKDPHCYLTAGQVSRTQLLTDTVYTCLALEKAQTRTTDINSYWTTPHHHES